METLRVKFGKNKYHLQGEMEKWCHATVKGKGGWFHTITNGNDWVISSMFGMTTFEFRRKEDALMFHLKWGGEIAECTDS